MARQMKDSGIEWIGQIPEEWEVSKISQLYVERKTKVSDREYPPLSVTMKGVVPQLSTAAKSDAHDDRKLLCKGDFAINSRSDRRGSCGVSKYDGSVSLINTVLMPNVTLNVTFYDWLFHTTMFADEFYKWGHGIVDDLWTTNWQDMKKIQIPVPELKEQQRIADFLDQKCAQIDEILQKTRDTITEYKKLKQSVITQAVTKGVRSERPMKDSGIEWIGEIPEEWEVHRIKNNFMIISGSGFKPEYQGNREGDFPVCKASDISNAKHRLVYATNYISKHLAELQGFSIIPNGSILFAKIGEAMKKNNRTICMVNCCVDNNCQGLVPNNIDSNFSYYIFSCIDMEWFDNAGTIPCINNQKLYDCKIPYPNYIEQQEIAQYLDQKCAEIDKLIEKKEQLVTELESYKKSLIYEYVTGKKEVVI